MKTVLSMRLILQDQTKATIRRELNSEMIPFLGLKIEHDHESMIQSVCYNVDEDYYYVTLSPEEHFETQKELETQIEGYKEYGWTVVGE